MTSNQEYCSLAQGCRESLYSKYSIFWKIVLTCLQGFSLGVRRPNYELGSHEATEFEPEVN